ncbi:alpha/beta fold hydrolase [Streptacidiphilus sp. N1-3]|uniref:Alpha/beta fold hydrolase n=1 Tax=Streptacidiphilus alkalitolerans TaxID=3342712 RepID=A0ABV6WWD5_9ACTN
MATVLVGDAEFGYDEAGSGPAVLLVHAGLADRRMWDHQFRALSADHRVIRYDWRGYGGSADARGEVARHEDLLALMDALAVDRAALVGCSYGGAHALDAALAAPDRVRALALVCSGLSGYAWSPETVELMRRGVRAAVPAERLRAYADRTAERVDPADVAAVAEANVRLMVVGPDRDPAELDPGVLERARAMCRGVFAREWNGPAFTEREPQRPALGRLAEIGAPTLVVNGLADLSAIQEIAGILVGGIAGARRIDLPATGHLPPLERPEQATAALADFLRGLPR